MPIFKDIFKTGAKTITTKNNLIRIVEFLKKNNDKAYTKQEISFDLRIAYGTVHITMQELTAKSIVDKKLIGKTAYYIYKDENEKNHNFTEKD